jgi:mannose-6-phosphate isomerase-like protein (cupin superfamily)
MKKVSESGVKFKSGDWGPKYLIQGPYWEGGIAVIKPGGPTLTTHYHNEVTEAFYFIEGNGKILIDDVAYEVGPGDLVYVEPKERHALINDGEKNLKCFFIKCPYKPEDKVECK